MYETFKDKGITTFRHLLELAAAHLDNAAILAQRLEVRSMIGLVLDSFRKALSNEDRALLAGQLTPGDSDPFPRLCIRPKRIDCGGPLLEQGQTWMPLDSVRGKILYEGCVKVLNKGKLNGRVDTHWRDHFKMRSEVKPVRGMLFKPPLTKNTEDLQWRI